MNHFDEYAALNEQLLHFIMSGQGDMKQADDVRDRMDEHWSKMSLVEQDLMRKRNEKAL